MMHANGGHDVGRSPLLPTKAVIDGLVRRAELNPPKAAIMAQIGGLVAEGLARWDMLENGDIEARFKSGEIYLFAESTITRLA